MHTFHELSHVGQYIRSFGLLAPVIALVLFTIQASLPVFPYAVLVAAAVVLFGAKNGFLLAMTGALLGSALCYWTCRRLGAEWFNRKILRHWGYDTNNINHSIAFWGIVVAHLIPFLPCAMINMAAAISRVSFGRFAISTTLGILPSTVVYTGLGLFIFHIQNIPQALAVTAVVLVIMLALKYILQDRLSIENPLLEHPSPAITDKHLTGLDGAGKGITQQSD